MVVTRLIAICCLALSLAHLPPRSVVAETALVFPLEQVLALSRVPHLDGAGFEAALLDVLPSAWTAMEMGNDAAAVPDPLRWSLGGTFGGSDGSQVEGAIFGCARYGLDTLDVFVSQGFASEAGFAMTLLAQPLFDDAEVWPEGAVARLSCSFTWDDARVVAILPEDVARRGLAAEIGPVERVAGGGEVMPTLYGEDGFRLEAQGTQRDSVLWLDSARVVLTLGHQQVTFRSFLMGGGM